MRKFVTIIFLSLIISGCQTTRDAPFVAVTKPITASLIENEAIMITGTGGQMTDDNLVCIEKSMTQVKPELDVVHDRALTNFLTPWLWSDSLTIEELSLLLENTEIRKIVESYNLRFLVTAEKYWWGMEAIIWDLKHGKSAGIVNSNSYMTYDTYNPKDIEEWIYFGISMAFIPQLLIAGLGPQLETETLTKSDPTIDCIQLGEYLANALYPN